MTAPMLSLIHISIRIVTTEGELLNPGGSMSGGAFRNNNNLLGRRREMEELEQQTKKWKARLTEIDADIAKYEKDGAQIRQKIETNHHLREELVLQQNTAKLQYDRANRDMEQAKEQLDHIRFESQGIEGQKKELQDELDKLQDQRKENEDQNKIREERIAECTDKLDQVREQQKQLETEDAQLQLDYTTLEQKKQFQQENVNRVAGELQNICQQMEEASGNNMQADERVRQKEAQIADLRQQMDQLSVQILSLIHI